MKLLTFNRLDRDNRSVGRTAVVAENIIEFNESKDCCWVKYQQGDTIRSMKVAESFKKIKKMVEDDG